MSMDADRKIRLGTRASQLAMWQSNWVKSQLESKGISVELIQIKTEGDIKTGPLAQIGGQGLFTKRLQIALLENEIDLAVHSLKDLPTEDHPQLMIAAVPERETTRDAFVSKRHTSFDALPIGARIGTGSVRRGAQLLHLRNDLRIEDIRGNVDTRLKKLVEQDFDAIILASAGLKRLGLGDQITAEFEPDQLLPAVGQGALGLETRADDDQTIQLVSQLSDPESYHRAMAERSMLKTLFAGCLAPVGAQTFFSDTDIGENGVPFLTLQGVVLSPDGKQRVIASHSLPMGESRKLGVVVAEALLAEGAEHLLGGRS